MFLFDFCSCDFLMNFYQKWRFFNIFSQFNDILNFMHSYCFIIDQAEQRLHWSALW